MTRETIKIMKELIWGHPLSKEAKEELLNIAEMIFLIAAAGVVVGYTIAPYLCKK